jgi:hypothetical protein
VDEEGIWLVLEEDCDIKTIERWIRWDHLDTDIRHVLTIILSNINPDDFAIVRLRGRTSRPYAKSNKCAIHNGRWCDEKYMVFQDQQEVMTISLLGLCVAGGFKFTLGDYGRKYTQSCTCAPTHMDVI